MFKTKMRNTDKKQLKINTYTRFACQSEKITAIRNVKIIVFTEEKQT